ncbi:unnamed protein product [Dicrocoelium dendriticum]|nr:unnamed protein product [Dicrocoelium dendriticum]
MASESIVSETEVNQVVPLVERRKQCLLCPLPREFLRVLPYHGGVFTEGTARREDRFLELAIVEARLNRKYSFTPLNSYCRIRLGDSRYETQTATGSSKHPLWNEVCRLPIRGGITHLSVVVMNEGLLLGDSKLAWTTIPLPQSLFEGATTDMWYELSGKQGQDMEGAIHLTMRVRVAVQLVPNYALPSSAPSAPQARSTNVPTDAVPPAPPASPARPITAEDVQAVKEVFPAIGEDTIRDLLQSMDADRDAVTSELLRMTTES